MKKLALLAAIAAVGISAPAMAQDDKGFGGLKVGVIGGYDHITVQPNGDKRTKGGFTYGGTVGYDVDVNGLLLGVEGEYADSTTKRSLGDGLELEPNREIYGGIRLGGEVAPNTLLYAKGGYVNSKMTVDGADFRSSEKLDGYRLGAGVEHIQGNIFGRIEYRFSDYADSLRPQRHQAVAAVGLRF